MSDLISREAAIDAFEKELCGNAREYAVGFNGAKKILENVSSAPRWIPVTERMPEEEEAVLVTTDWGFLYIAEYAMFPDGEGRWSETVEGRFVDAVAWMPLPDPWRGEEDEERLDATEQG